MRVEVLRGAWLGGFALGCIALEPWRFEPWAAALTGVVAVALLAEAAVATVRIPRPVVLPALTKPERVQSWRAGLEVALLVLLLATAIAWLLHPLTRPPDAASPVPPTHTDLLAQRAAGTAAAPAQRDATPERILGYVRFIERDEAPPPAPIYLRESVLDEVEEKGGFVFFVPRQGDSTRRTAAAGERQIAWPEPSRRDRGPTVTFEVTLVDPELTRLPVVSVPHWIGADALDFTADGALPRPTVGGESFTFRVGAAPAEPVPAAERGDWQSMAETRTCGLPRSFADRRWLEQRVDKLTASAENDLGKARRLAIHLSRTGRLDAMAPFFGHRAFLEGEGRHGTAEHFAQCFVVLARLARMSARVVVGYRADEYDPAARNYVLRARHRHAWAEVEFAEAGWLVFDPAPPSDAAAPPQRRPETIGDSVEQPPSFSVSGEPWRETFARHRPLIVGILLLLLVLAFILIPAFRMPLLRLLRSPAPPGVAGPARRAWRYWQELLEVCRRQGIAPHPAHTARELSERLGSALPQERAALNGLVAVYHRCRFGRGELATSEEVEVRALLARLPAALSHWKQAARDRNRR